MARRKHFFLIAVIALSVVTSGCISRKINDNEKELLITFQDIKAVYKLPQFETAQCEKFTTQVLINDAKKLEYEFNSQKNPDNQPNIIVIKSIIDIMPSGSRADSIFEQSIKGYKLGLSLNNKEVKLVEDPKLVNWGDENFSSYLTVRDEKAGNFIMVRKGNAIFTLILAGFYIDDKEILFELLHPRLEKAIRYFNKN